MACHTANVNPQRPPEQTFVSRSERDRPRCGARCRDGHACRAPAVWDRNRQRPRNGRCRMHGGLSTGPRTQAGRTRCAEAAREAQLRRWARWRAAKTSAVAA